MDRQGFVHEALLIGPVDDRGPGGAITLALCGSWEHPPPCPLAAHHTATSRAGDRLRIRTVFATEPGREGEVRRRIEDALARQQVRDSDGVIVTWIVLSAGPGTLDSDERELADRLTLD